MELIVRFQMTWFIPVSLFGWDVARQGGPWSKDAPAPHLPTPGRQTTTAVSIIARFYGYSKGTYSVKRNSVIESLPDLWARHIKAMS